MRLTFSILLMTFISADITLHLVDFLMSFDRYDLKGREYMHCMRLFSQQSFFFAQSHDIHIIFHILQILQVFPASSSLSVCYNFFALSWLHSSHFLFCLNHVYRSILSIFFSSWFFRLVSVWALSIRGFLPNICPTESIFST